MARKRTTTKVQCSIDLGKKHDRLFRMLVAVKETTVRELLEEAVKYYLMNHDSMSTIVTKIEAEAKRA